MLSSYLSDEIEKVVIDGWVYKSCGETVEEEIMGLVLSKVSAFNVMILLVSGECEDMETYVLTDVLEDESCKVKAIVLKFEKRVTTVVEENNIEDDLGEGRGLWLSNEYEGVAGREECDSWEKMLDESITGFLSNEYEDVVTKTVEDNISEKNLVEGITVLVLSSVVGVAECDNWENVPRYGLMVLLLSTEYEDVLTEIREAGNCKDILREGRMDLLQPNKSEESGTDVRKATSCEDIVIECGLL